MRVDPIFLDKNKLMSWICVDCRCRCGLCKNRDCLCECHNLDTLSKKQLIELIAQHTCKFKSELRALSRNHLYKVIRYTGPKKILQVGYKLMRAKATEKKRAKATEKKTAKATKKKTAEATKKTAIDCQP